MASIQKVKRNFPPKHFSLRIESFSKVAGACTEAYGMKSYETIDFSAEGYSWKLNLYPNGNTKGNGKDHISLYLAIDDLASNEDVHVKFKFFVFDEKDKQYLAIYDDAVKRFHHMKTEWGFDQLISLDDFKSPNNGYLVNDICEFGVELSVVSSSTEKRQTLSIIKPPLRPFRSTFGGLSKMGNDFHFGPDFTFGGKTWKVKLYPRGWGKGAANYISIYLELVNGANVRPGEQVWAEYKMRVIHQRQRKHNIERTFQHWFTGGNNCNWGSDKFLSLVEIYVTNKGFLMKDTLIVDVEFVDVSTTNIFTN